MPYSDRNYKNMLTYLSTYDKYIFQRISLLIEVSFRGVYDLMFEHNVATVQLAF